MRKTNFPGNRFKKKELIGIIITISNYIIVNM